MHLTNFGDKLKLLRKSYNLTQKDLANKLNITKQAVSLYELGKREPSLNFVIELSKTFNCSIDELLSINTNNFSKFNNIDKLLEINTNVFDIKELSFNLEKKKIQLENLKKDIPKKLKEIDELIEFIEKKNSDEIEKNNTKKEMKKELNKNKKDSEIGEEICIDFETKKQEKIKKEYVKIPVYDLCISAGEPLCSENAVIDKTRNLELKKPLTKTNLEEFYILKIDGDSMNNIVDDGEEILVQGTPYVNNGEIAVVTLLKDSKSTLKHYYRIGDEVILKPNSSNPKHRIQKYNLRDEDILVQGKYIGKVKDFL